MLIQRGKAEGWLTVALPALKQWAAASGIEFLNAAPTVVPGRGIALVATSEIACLSPETPSQVLRIAEDLVLSVEAVKKHAVFDGHFRELLESIGDFGSRNLLGNQTPRGAILSFLLFQASVSCPHLSERVGVHVPFTEYVKSLPCELLPTFWSADELQLLTGTTLAPAVSAKLKSLRREYDLVCESAANTRWFRIVEPFLDFDDWVQVDAMFRSRALDFHGSCMIPGMDLASHAAGDRTNAFYDKGDGIYSLWFIEGKELQKGQEVTITYGDEKGACEMLFSYGFLENEMETAETLFLSLTIPDSDTTRKAKMQIADCAPGFKIIDASAATTSNESISGDRPSSENEPETGEVDWTSDFVWLLCVGFDDGLRFELARTVDGEEELQATFKGQELKHGAADLHRILAQSDLWPVYRLRAIVILQQRVWDQMQILYTSQEDVEAMPHGETTSVREVPYQQALKLRKLEFELLEKAYEDFEKQKHDLVKSPVVQEYLESMNSEPSQQTGENEEEAEEEDFS